MAVSTRLSLVVIYLFTAISSVHTVTNHGSAEYFFYTFYYTLNTTHCQNGTGFMPWYKLSQTDCATVTHLYNLCPNTEQQHVIRTVRNIVREHRGALVHHIEYNSMHPPHDIMGRLCRQVTIF